VPTPKTPSLALARPKHDCQAQGNAHPSLGTPKGMTILPWHAHHPLLDTPKGMTTSFLGTPNGMNILS